MIPIRISKLKVQKRISTWSRISKYLFYLERRANVEPIERI